jgi:plastocyanin
MRTLILGLILVSLIISGCLISQPEQNLTNETPPPPPPPPAKTPVISIASPGEGEVIMAPGDTADVTLTLSTQNLLLKSPGGAAKKGEGHFRVTVDNGVPQTVTSKTYVMSGLQLGTHSVKVELLNNDRTPYSPVIVEEATFTIEKEKPPEYVPREYTVNVGNFTYDPSDLTVKVGDSVVFRNVGAYPRSATCFIGGKQVFDTQVLSPDNSATVTFHEIVECEYYSTTHRAMTGTLKVESNGTSG